MDLKKEIEKIKKRNIRVEADKAWELSLMRRGFIAVGTYFTILLFLFMIKAPNPWLTAVVPAAAYVLSTLTLPYIKQWWVKNFYKRK